MRALILGSKEFPLGTADSSDPNPSGGMEMYVNGLAEALASKGIEVTVLTRRFKCTKEFEKKGRISVVRVPFVKGFYFRNPSFNIMAFLRSLALDFDIIISNGEVSNAFSLALSRIRHKPAIMVSHGLASAQPQYNRILKWVFGAIDNLTYPRADAVITHSPWQMKKITRYYDVVMPGFDRRRLKRLPGKESASLRSKYAKGYEKVIIYTGRLIAVKGLDFLIRSLKMVNEKHVCIIVGNGPDMAKLKELAEKEGANVVFTGFRKDVSRFLSIADVFVLPSFSESLNYSLLEAAFMGVPIVCSDIGIIGRDSAELAKPGDEHSIANSINKVLAKKDHKTENAKKYALTFDWDKASDLYIKIMEGLVR